MTLISQLMSFLICRQWSHVPNGRVCTGARAGTSCLRVTLHADGLCMIHLCLHLYARAALARLLTCHDPISRDSCVSACVITVLIWMRVYTFGLFLLEIEGTVYPKMKMLSSLPLMLFPHLYADIFSLLINIRKFWRIFTQLFLHQSCTSSWIELRMAPIQFLN